MNVMTASFGALLAAWVINNTLSRIWPGKTILLLASLIEESSKTMLALLLNASVVPVHLFFGMGEAFHDIFLNKRNGYLAGLLSIITHTLLGSVTFILWSFFHHIVFAIFVAAILHLIWNGISLGRFSNS